MKRRFAAGVVALCCLLEAGSSWALSVTLEPKTPAVVGEPHAFRVADVQDAVGTVTYTWNFGDGVRGDPITELEATHTYETAGHYTVILLARDESGATTANYLQTAHNPLTEVPPSHSSSTIYDGARDRVYNVNPDNDTITATDAEALSVVFEVPVGKQPRTLAQAPDGTIWVTNQLSDEIVILDPDSGSEAARIDMPYASQPHSIAFSPDGLAYVSLFATGKVAQIDPQTEEILVEAEVGPTPAAIAISHDGRVFVTRFISPVDHGQIWELNPTTLEVIHTITLAFDPGPDTEAAGRGVPNYVSNMVISPDGTQAWVTAKKDNTARGPQRDGLPMNSDSFVRAILCVIDMQTAEENLGLRQDIDNRSLPWSVAFSPLGDYGLILALGSNWVGLNDAYQAFNISGIVDVGLAPDGLALRPDGRLFVNGYLSRTLQVYDVSQAITGVDTLVPPAIAEMPTVDTELLDPQILLGKRVFYNAADRRMSNDGYMACTTCHLGGFHDGRVWDFTDRGEGLRNTKMLMGIRGTGEGRVHWSANFDEIQDFERDIRHSLEGFGFMPDEEWAMREGDPFGTPAAGVSPELDALAAYIASLDTVGRSPFREPDGKFTKDALRGKKIFEQAVCPACHSGPDFTDSASGVLHDVGTILPTSGHRLGGDLPGFDTPTLKGLWQTAPYLHDGRAETLMDIFTENNPDDLIGKTSDLDEKELGYLVSYLQQLDDVEAPPQTLDEDNGGFWSCSIQRRTSPTGAHWLAALAALFGAAWLRRRRS